MAERPFDRGLRLVFADWLLDQGDERGAVIVAASGEAPLTERRRLARVVERNLAHWLGPLAALADVGATRFEAGFLHHLVCVPRPPPELWGQLTGELRLATVRSLVLPSGHESPLMTGFVTHAVLRHLERVQASMRGWALLDGALPGLRTVALSSWGTFQGELDVLRGRKAQALELVTSEFVNPMVAAEVRTAVVSELGAVQGFEDVTLVVRFGVVEGVASWLIGAGADGLDARWQQRAWGAEYGEARFVLQRREGSGPSLVVDLTHRGDVAGLGQRIATAASVLVQLAPARLEALEVKVPPGARVRPSERDALRAAARRLGTVKSFSIAGAFVTP